MNWFLLIFSLISLAVGVYCIKIHKELDKELEHGNPYKVRYSEYLISGLAAYVLTPVSIFALLGCIYLILVG